jgi:TetR/AcrR family transcriptional regulator
VARVWETKSPSPARQQATEALLDAAERLLFEVGYAGVTTRRVAQEAGVKHGLVHYYFGSMEELLTQTLERFADRLAEPLAALYASPDLTFGEKWRIGARFFVEEPTSRFPKILLELSAMSWNVPPLRRRIAAVHARFRAIFEPNFRAAMHEYGIDESRFPIDAVVAMVTSFQLGLIVERLSGVEAGHNTLLRSIEDWLESLEARH